MIRLLVLAAAVAVTGCGGASPTGDKSPAAPAATTPAAKTPTPAPPKGKVQME